VAFLYLYPVALDTMGSSRQAIGWVMGVFSLAAVVVRPIMGKLVLRTGEYRVISLGLGVCLVASLGYMLVSEFGALMLIVRIMHGVGFSAFVSGSFSLAARGFHPDRRAESFGILGAALMGAVAVAPPLGERLIREHGFGSLYAAAAVSVLLAWAAVVAVGRKVGTPGERKIRVRYLPLFKDRGFLMLLGSTLALSHCQATVSNFLALIAFEKESTSGGYFFISFVSAILVLLVMGRSIDRYGKREFLKVSYPFFAIGVALIPAVIASGLFWISALLFGLGLGFLFSTHNALAAGEGTEAEKPATMSVFTGVYDSGFITGGIVSGWFAQYANLDALFIGCSLLAVSGWGLMVLPFREQRS